MLRKSRIALGLPFAVPEVSARRAPPAAGAGPTIDQFPMPGYPIAYAGNHWLGRPVTTQLQDCRMAGLQEGKVNPAILQSRG